MWRVLDYVANSNNALIMLCILSKANTVNCGSSGCIHNSPNYRMFVENIYLSKFIVGIVWYLTSHKRTLLYVHQNFFIFSGEVTYKLFCCIN